MERSLHQVRVITNLTSTNWWNGSSTSHTTYAKHAPWSVKANLPPSSTSPRRPSENCLSSYSASYSLWRDPAEGVPLRYLTPIKAPRTLVATGAYPYPTPTEDGTGLTWSLLEAFSCFILSRRRTVPNFVRSSSPVQDCSDPSPPDPAHIVWALSRLKYVTLAQPGHFPKGRPQ